jgi:hypothetical protein
MCREELIAFHAAAQARGVPELILPVVLAGRQRINSSSSDDLIRTVAARNWIAIDESWELGYASPEWKRCVGQIVTGLDHNLDVAAKRLLVEQAPPTSSSQATTPQLPDLAPIISHLREVNRTFSEMNELTVSIAETVAARVDGRNLADLSDAQRTFLFGALSQELADPAKTFGSKAAHFEALVTQLDAELRTYMNELSALGLKEPPEDWADFRSAVAGLDSMAEYGESVEELQGVLQLAAMSSVPLRKALAPMTVGLQSLRIVSNTTQSWTHLTDGFNWK